MNRKRFTLFKGFAALMIAMLVITALPVSLAFAAAGVTQNWRTASAPGWNFYGVTVPLTWTPWLTAGVPAGPYSPGDSSTDGWLRLTDNRGSEAGSVIYNSAYTPGNGIQVSFTYASYGGTHADGISFYLIDGATGSPTVGAPGGSLGYSYNTAAALPGVTNGVIGIGFDEYGNFTNTGFGSTSAGFNPNNIAIRGSGTLNSGFPLLNHVSVPGGIEAPRAGAHHVTITITSAAHVTVAMDGTTYINDFASGIVLPATFKMGFSSSTGGQMNIHEIRDLTVTGIAPTATAVVTSGTPSVTGNSVTFTATVSGYVATNDMAGDTVEFYDVNTLLGSGTVSGALGGPYTATFATSTLSVAGSPHVITAKYLGDSYYAPSAGSTNQTVVTCSAPTVSSVAPVAGPTGGGTAVVITGNHFNETSCAATSAAFGGSSVTSGFLVISNTEIHANTPNHAAGLVNVTVTGPGGTGTGVGLYTYVPPPTITGISPTMGPTSGGQTVTITGTNLLPFTSVTFGGTAATCPGPNSGLVLVCTTPAHSAGTVNVAVTTDGGTGTMTNAYTFVPPPTIVSVSPNHGPTAGGTVVIISGANLTGAGFSFAGISASCSINALGNQATCTTPPHVVGPVNVTVSSWGGNMTLANAFTYEYGATLPGTGFAPNRITALPLQSVSYTDLGDLWLEIPKLGVQMSIVGIPQSADGQWDVSWLGNDAGWLNGTAFPTWAGNSVLTGHVWNADNTAGPFAYLNTLWYGDKVIVHAWGGQYVYEVRSVLQVSPGNTDAMMKHQDQPWLTLVTCRGFDAASDTYKYRVLVRAVLVETK